ncbi:endothelin-converting enzyme homolog isoform X2 [Gigantopelta aegis]|uniref:endothelin-converting enzyme homolog isoform X2 n=1 Tax=Gigantopelta aegis TaxID=1735272 RepID=UPI001B88B52E|nr:endothelin-converting enzyme homolog isoform X2 [Gigantopelta aegis]
MDDVTSDGNKVAVEMSGQRYKRTNFEDDDMSNGGTPPPIDFNPSIMFKGGLTSWQRRTLLERALIVVLIIVGICLIVLATLVAVKEKKTDYCLTPECITISSAILSAMDSTADPCQDFFTYACGGWIKTHPIPSGHSRWGTFSVLWQQNQLVMKNSIGPESSFRCEAERKSKRYYDSCIDKNKTIEKVGSKPLLQILTDIGGWSLSNTSGVWNITDWDFEETLQQIHLLDINPLFNAWVSGDDRNSSRNILQADQSGLGLPERDYYLNKSITDDKVLSAYLEYMTTISVLLGAPDKEIAREEMTQVIEFETLLANITIPAQDRRDEEKLYHKITIQDMQSRFPFLNWLNYFNTMLGLVKISVKSTESVVVYAPKYLKNLNTILEQSLQTENKKRVLNNYLVWHVVKALTPYLSKPFRQAKRTFREAMTGVSGNEEIWRTCITDTDAVLGFALGAMFVREAFHGDSKAKVNEPPSGTMLKLLQAEEMIREVKTAFKKNLPNLKWMDEDTRKAAVDKANAVVDMIGFPEYILNATQLDKEYDRLKINSSEYFQNNMRNLKFALIRNMEKLRQSPKKNVWGMTPPTVNAYYTPTKNEIVFPAGILQAPFYDRNFPKSLNFGAMGVVMGHELTHGFDDQGREYDKFGNLVPWWNKESVERFKQRTKCMINQYSQYKSNGENVRGKQTLGENIADNGGLKSAYNSYRTWVQKHGAERELPALNMTHNQLFFLGFSQVWCSLSTKEADHLQLLSDPHSPAKFRVIGTLSNSHEFAREYNCPVNSPMNPKKKCEVW